jgi:hypothetical protein
MAQLKIDFKTHRPVWKPPTKISPLQYLEVLFNDLQYDRLHRNDKLSNELGRPVKFLDELQEDEIKKMISIMREQKYGKDQE